jgi:hypothetical protein
LAKERHIFIDFVELALLRSSGEEYCSVSTWDGIFFGRWLNNRKLNSNNILKIGLIA